MRTPVKPKYLLVAFSILLGVAIVTTTKPPSFALKIMPDSETASATFAVAPMKSVEALVRPSPLTNLASIFPSPVK